MALVVITVLSIELKELRGKKVPFTVERLDPGHELLPALVARDHLAHIHDVEGILLRAALHDLPDQAGRGPRPVHHGDQLFLFYDLHG